RFEYGKSCLVILDGLREFDGKRRIAHDHGDEADIDHRKDPHRARSEREERERELEAETTHREGWVPRHSSAAWARAPHARRRGALRFARDGSRGLRH